MDEGQFFDFEEKIDFPFYKDLSFDTRYTKLLALSVILFILLVFIPLKFKGHQQEIIFCLATLIPFLVAVDGNMGYLFKKPKFDDIKTIAIGLVGCFLVVFIVAVLSNILGIPSMIDPSGPLVEPSGLIGFLFEFIQIIGEELFKIMAFLFIMGFIYKATQNRKYSIVIATFFTLILFGLMHVNSYYNILYCIFSIGFGSLMELYPYIKSKNIVLTIIVHFLFNLLVTLIHFI